MADLFALVRPARSASQSRLHPRSNRVPTELGERAPATRGAEARGALRVGEQLRQRAARGR